MHTYIWVIPSRLQSLLNEMNVCWSIYDSLQPLHRFVNCLNEIFITATWIHEESIWRARIIVLQLTAYWLQKLVKIIAYHHWIFLTLLHQFQTILLFHITTKRYQDYNVCILYTNITIATWTRDTTKIEVFLMRSFARHKLEMWHRNKHN